MKTKTALAVVVIVTTMGIVGATIGAGILSQQAHALACNFFISPHKNTSKCSSTSSFNHANTANSHHHVRGTE
jgi:hypothetical protein